MVHISNDQHERFGILDDVKRDDVRMEIGCDGFGTRGDQSET